MSSTKRKCLTIADKAVIIQRLQGGELNKTIAKEYGVPHSTISTIMKNKQTVEKIVNYTNNPNRIRMRKPAVHRQVEEALIQWWKQNQETTITTSMLRRKAYIFASELNIPNFECSVSWISRFKARHNLVDKNVWSQLPMGPNAVNKWLAEEWPDLRAKFTDDQIFNAKETELFPKSKDRTNKPKGRKGMAKSKLTVMIAANLNGTVTKKLFVTGRSKLNENVIIPVDYEYNKKAEMTADIFTKWLRSWDESLTQKNEKILLIIDNYPIHPTVNDLKNVTLCFLPHSISYSAPKPCERIIEHLESNFYNLNRKFIKCNFKNDDNAESYNVPLLDTIQMIYEAWNKITQIIIVDSFKKAGFLPKIQQYPANTSNSNHEEDPLNTDTDEPLKIEFEEEEENVSEISELPCDEKIAPDAETENKLQGKENNGDKKEGYFVPGAFEALMAAEELSLFVNSNFEDNHLKSMMARIHGAVRDAYLLSSK